MVLVQGKTQWSVVKSSDVALVPSVGDVVTAKVLKMTPRFIVTEMQCIGSQAIPAPFTGVIRLQDVRALEIDKVRCPLLFCKRKTVSIAPYPCTPSCYEVLREC
jgi:exosome complex RNA-binding protein Csl4